MAQTNTVSVFVQMTAVTASGIADRPEDCSKLLLQWLRSSFCQVLFLSQWQRGSRTQQIEDVVWMNRPTLSMFFFQFHLHDPVFARCVNTGITEPFDWLDPPSGTVAWRDKVLSASQTNSNQWHWRPDCDLGFPSAVINRDNVVICQSLADNVSRQTRRLIFETRVCWRRVLSVELIGVCPPKKT